MVEHICTVKLQMLAGILLYNDVNLYKQYNKTYLLHLILLNRH